VTAADCSVVVAASSSDDDDNSNAAELTSALRRSHPGDEALEARHHGVELVAQTAQLLRT